MWWNCAFFIFASLLGSSWIVHAVDDNPAGTAAQNVDADSNGEKFTPEVECSRVGGICLARESCPPEKVSEEGQCPKQSGLGAVCCHSLSATETRCQQLGGHCRETCPEHMVISQATDCGAEEKCCPLV